MKQMQPELTIVIPAYREAKRVGKTLDQLASFIRTNTTLKNLHIEVIVVSADSPDKTHTIVEGKAKLFPNFRLIKPGLKVGKGRDVKQGMLAAVGQAVIFMDADLATPLSYLPVFYKAFTKGSDVVIGTRNLRKHHPSFWRRSLSNIGNILYRILGGVWVEDSQCGFKLFSKNAAQNCFTKMTIQGWGFDMEVLTIAKVNHLSIKSVRVNDWVSVPEGTFEESALKSSISSLTELFYIFYHRLLGHYRA